jgi:hypothetical protein
MNHLYTTAMVEARRRTLTEDARHSAHVRAARAATATGRQRSLRSARWLRRPRLQAVAPVTRVQPA